MSQVTAWTGPEVAELARSLASLAEAIRIRDEGTQSHDQEVGLLGVEIAQRMGLDIATQERIFLAGLVHDLGKIGIRDDILLKEGPLDPVDRAHMERHPELGAEILRPLPGAAPIAEIILAHHECPDGSGYPRGLAGDAIPLEARILQVADVFCALGEARPYKPAMDPLTSLAWMRREGGHRFDLPCLRALGSVLSRPEPI